MIILLVVLIMDGRAAHIQESPFVHTQPRDDGLYSLEALFMELDDVDPANVLIIPDGSNITQGEEITDEIRSLAMPLDVFQRATKEQAAADALGLVMRAPVAEGVITDEELIRVAPALTERMWRPGVDVVVGDVYTFMDCLWRCITAHSTQGNWQPDKVPALWRKVEVVHPDTPRVWQMHTDYTTGDRVRYPDTQSPLYLCLQGHMSQAGWEPPNAPALWTLAMTE